MNKPSVVNRTSERGAYVVYEAKQPAVGVEVFGEQVLRAVDGVDEKVVVPSPHAVLHVKYALRVEDLGKTRQETKKPWARNVCKPRLGVPS